MCCSTSSEHLCIVRAVGSCAQITSIHLGDASMDPVATSAGHAPLVRVSGVKSLRLAMCMHYHCINICDCI